MVEADLRDRVQTIAILMLENRSYDHMMSFLSLGLHDDPRPEIDGLTSLRKAENINSSKTKVYRPWVTNDDPLVCDLPHGRDLIELQIRSRGSKRAIDMRGFVEAYRREGDVSSIPTHAAPMSIQNRPWMFEYFAKHHQICTRWFAPLPTDTQPNRLMALSGYTNYDTTRGRVIEQRPLIFDWLNERGVRWRVYRSGIPFEMLIRSMWDDVFNPTKFKSIKELAIDVGEESNETFPQVIFIEPAFSDSPITVGYQPNDDHPPTGIGPGQQFVRYAYAALSSDPKRWSRMVLIVTYDEHGGFYDHVHPLSIPTLPPPESKWEGEAFRTTGVRIPGIIASPLVRPGVSDQTLDHTSILQFVAAVFGKDQESYSTDVAARRDSGIGNLVDTLSDGAPRSKIPKPPQVAPITAAVPGPRSAPTVAGAKKKSKNAKAFEAATKEVLRDVPREQIQKTYPEILSWEKTR